MEMGLACFHLGICLSPFPYGDHHMETGTWFIVFPIWKWGYPHENGDTHMEMGIYKGCVYPRFHMVIPI